MSNSDEMLACVEGDMDIFRDVVRVFLDVLPDSVASLREAISSINNGADINPRDKVGWTPLFWASFKRHHAVVALLLRYGAKADVEDDDGQTRTRRPVRVSRPLVP